MEKIIETRNGTFVIRPFLPEDEEGVLSLWEAAFGRKMPLSLWKWKYTHNPYGYRIMLCLAKDSLPVAMYSGIPYSSDFADQDATFIHLMDNMSHPDFRGSLSGRKGLFVKTAEHFFDVYGGNHDSIFMYGFPGARHFKLGKILLKYQSFYEGTSYLEAEPCLLLQKNKWPGIKMEKIAAPGSDFDDLYHQTKTYFPFSVKRDKGFVQWRFFDHPSNVYDVYIFKSFFNRPRGYAVLSIKEKTACIVDLFCVPEEKKLRMMISELARKLMDSGIEIVQTWMPAGHFFCDCLLRLGFRVSPEPLGFIAGGRTFWPGLSFEYASENIYYNMADSDLL